MTEAELREAIRTARTDAERQELEAQLRDLLDKGQAESQDSGGHGGGTPPRNDPK